MNERELLREIDKHKEAISVLKEQLNAVRPNKQIKCPTCDKRSAVKNISLVKDYRYDAWGADPGFWLSGYVAVCPKCHETIYFDAQSEFIRTYAEYFLEVLVSERDTMGPLSLKLADLPALRKKQSNRRGY